MNKTAKTVLVLVVLLAIVALLAYVAKPNMVNDTAMTQYGDSETTQIEDDATANFSDGDDISSLEADLGMSISQMEQQ